MNSENSQQMANSFVLILSIDVLPVRLFEKRNWSLVKVACFWLDWMTLKFQASFYDVEVAHLRGL